MDMNNIVILNGNIGADAEKRYTPDGVCVVRFRLATTQRWKKDGEQQEKTEWHTLVGFGKRFESAAEYLKKGAGIRVLGHLRTRKWEDRDGNTRYATEVVIDDFQFNSGKRQDSHDSVDMPDDMGVDEINDNDIPF